VPVEKLVFVDESGVSTSMQRLRGRSPKGERCRATEPLGHGSITALIGAVRLAGPLACATFDGPVDGDAFVAWLDHDLCPQLNKGDVVVMDNLSAHKNPGVARAIEAVGARLLYLPPYSPDFNPIENMWSKVKEALRAAAARTRQALGEAVEAAIKTVSADDCRGFFQNSRYAI
jgi:transposase